MSSLKIHPMGGLGEIGSNMSVIETDNELLVIDYGILFPNDEHFDINYLIVDTTKLRESNKKKTLFITHGHEDHIGAVMHIVREIPEMEIYAPKLASVLIEEKFKVRNISRKVNVYDEDFKLIIDHYEVHPIHVTHSIPHTFGLVIYSPEQSVLFISDFKFDLNPLFEAPFNYQKIQQLFAKSKSNLAMIDSTNILSEGRTLSESDLTDTLSDLLSVRKRTFITLFSSNLYRIRNIMEIAKKKGLKVTTIGRSLGKYLEAAKESKLFSIEDYPYIEFDAIQNYEDPKVLYLVTGSQGEFLGAAKRIINGDQKHIKLTENDRFIFSSKPIPGNTKNIYQLFNKLSDIGVELITYKTHQVHASGHPCQQDLKELITLIKPDHYIPIHGETYFLRKHIEFIKANFPQIRPYFLTNFENVIFKNDEVKIFEGEEYTPLLIHGNDLVIEREKISERRKISTQGVVFVSMNFKTKNVQVTTQGLPVMADEQMLKFKDYIEYTLNELKNRDHDYICEQVRIKTRKFYHSFLGYRPVAIVHMV